MLAGSYASPHVYVTQFFHWCAAPYGLFFGVGSHFYSGNAYGIHFTYAQSSFSNLMEGVLWQVCCTLWDVFRCWQPFLLRQRLRYAFHVCAKQFFPILWRASLLGSITWIFSSTPMQDIGLSKSNPHLKRPALRPRPLLNEKEFYEGSNNKTNLGKEDW